MKVLWVGDATVSSGFSRCTHAVCDELHSRGHDVHVLGINYHGDPHNYDYKIYPCYQPLDGGRDFWGVGRLQGLVDRLSPDAIVILQDPWNFKTYFDNLETEVPVVGWVAVDAQNQVGDQLNDLEHVVVWTEFAKSELKNCGCNRPISVIPLGVGQEFQPKDKEESRKMFLPEAVSNDSFIVGVVGRNQPRKRLDLTIRYFAKWVSDFSPNAHLYLHIAPTGDRGFDIIKLTRYYGLQNKVILSEPDVENGIRSSNLSYLYSSFDAYLTTSQGEGWGLPTLESMACGVPCIVPNWSGLGCWVPQDCAIKVPCTSTGINAPLNSRAYTIGGVPDEESVVQAIHSLYTSKPLCSKFSKSGIELASKYSWSETGSRFADLLSAICQ